MKSLHKDAASPSPCIDMKQREHQVRYLIKVLIASAIRAQGSGLQRLKAKAIGKMCKPLFSIDCLLTCKRHMSGGCSHLGRLSAVYQLLQLSHVLACQLQLLVCSGLLGLPGLFGLAERTLRQGRLHQRSGRLLASLVQLRLEVLLGLQCTCMVTGISHRYPCFL